MSECQHKSIIGDNYGDSCGECGKQLTGYGYGGFFGVNIKGNEICIHVYDRSGICVYCQGLKPSNLESNRRIKMLTVREMLKFMDGNVIEIADWIELEKFLETHLSVFIDETKVVNDAWIKDELKPPQS